MTVDTLTNTTRSSSLFVSYNFYVLPDGKQGLNIAVGCQMFRRPRNLFFSAFLFVTFTSTHFPHPVPLIHQHAWCKYTAI